MPQLYVRNARLENSVDNIFMCGALRHSDYVDTVIKCVLKSGLKQTFHHWPYEFAGFTDEHGIVQMTANDAHPNIIRSELSYAPVTEALKSISEEDSRQWDKRRHIPIASQTSTLPL